MLQGEIRALAVSLTHFDVSTGIDLVHSIPWHPTSLSIEVIALHEDRVVRQAPNPHVALSHVVQLDAFADVQSGLFGGVVAMHIGELAEAEASNIGGVGVAVDSDLRVGAGDFERLSNLERSQGIRVQTVNRGASVQRHIGF